MKSAFMIIWLLLLNTMLFAQQSTMKEIIDQQFAFAAKQYLVLAEHTPADRLPKTYYSKDNKWETSDTRWWCSGFYPGTLLYIYEHTKDANILAEAENKLAILEKEKHYKNNHDLGFMMFCSFGNAYRILGDEKYKPTIDTAAETLALRYRPTIKAIQSWNSFHHFKCPVIIDNMMNLELLMWSAQHGGDKKLSDIATTHANTTIKNHFREDYSSYHVIDYNIETGEVLKKVTWQGANDSSAWSRGQAWGLYGYTMMYRFTKDKAYLKQAKNIAQFILDNPTLPEDKIPYYDFDAPGIPDAVRDASAAAITASALLELGQFVKKKERKEYVGVAEKMIRSLASSDYRAKAGENGGFLLLHSTGAFPNSEVDVPLTYADYYYVEALHRYKNWYLK